MTVRVEHISQVCIVTIDRPDRRNALDYTTIEALGIAIASAEENDVVRVVVLTGSGDRAFCAGKDLTTQGPRPDTTGIRRFDSLREAPCSKPLIAAVNGSAMGAGFELVLLCDVVVASTTACFALPEVRRGLIAGAGGTLLPFHIPLNLALELGMTGAPIDSSRALQLGLVNRVVELDALRDEVLGLATTIAANSPLAVETTRMLMHETRALTYAEARERARAVAPALATGPDATEGRSAFLEHRPPIWPSAISVR